MMQQSIKILLGKILGEIYRVQNASKMCAASPGRIYGLLNGIEDAIDYELDTMSLITRDKVKAVCDVLNPIFSDSKRLEEFTGFYDIEGELKGKGVNRVDAIRILKYLKAEGRFIGVIEKMNSENSPIECKTFELNEWDR